MIFVGAFLIGDAVAGFWGPEASLVFAGFLFGGFEFGLVFVGGVVGVFLGIALFDH